MSASMQAPSDRVRASDAGDDRPVRPDGDYVLYWMIAARRVRHSFALQHAAHWARELNKPLVVLEALRCGYEWASDRLHAFVLDGMADQAAAFARAPVLYHPYVEPRAGAGKGLLRALGERACVVVTDEYPGFFLPRMVTAAAGQLAVKLERVDGNGLYPLAATERVFATAMSFRRLLHGELRPHLAAEPRAEPLRGLDLPRLGALPAAIVKRWPAATTALLSPEHRGLHALPIDHAVTPVATRGGAIRARALVRELVERKLERYAGDRNHPDKHATSGLSPYLHFGHIGAHEVFQAVMAHEGWSAGRLATRPTGKRAGWWGVSDSAEAFLDQLVTWRELGFHTAARDPEYERYESLPAWARATLEAHRGDVREHVYSAKQFAAADTHDPLWNAAQTELSRDGRIHNYLRMLWGKKILEWTPDPRVALAVMIELNNRYALDGRDPNSYSGIFWCLGRYDRAWGPERPVYGKIRYMSSAAAARKIRLREYLARYRP